MNSDFDIAIIGSGFAGSLLAMIARRQGRSVALIERGRHPRFAIGESSTPLVNLLLEHLAARYDLPNVAALSKWGTWQRTHPAIACGLKRGFTFYHHRHGETWRPTADRRNELLVAASPHDGIADTHWFRADFDAFLAREAQSLGVELMEETALEAADFTGEVAMLRGQQQGKTLNLRARFVVDASGTRGFLQRALGLPETSFPAMPETEGLYSHFEDVRRWDKIVPSDVTPPYPVDDAALHHVFDGGWIWVLRFNNGITSAGVSATQALARELNFSDGAGGWARLLERLPSVRAQFAEARAVRPFVHARRLSFCCRVVAGPRWALLPSAAGFIDPLLSTGFPLTLLGIERLARALEEAWESPRLPAALADYATQTLGELDAAAALVGALFANLGDFEAFSALSLLYFAAASYSETARRLGRPELASSFLLHREKKFGPALRACLELAREPGAEGLLNAIRQTIGPINVAGLGDPARRNWHPALAEDLLCAAPKLGVGRDDIERLLARCGFHQTSSA